MDTHTMSRVCNRLVERLERKGTVGQTCLIGSKEKLRV